MKKTIKLNKIALGISMLLMFGTAITGCKKESSDILNRNLSDKTTQFNSMEDFSSALKKVEEMGEQERRDYERKNNYKSLLTKVYEVYEEIDMDNLKDKETLLEHVNKNNHYLEISNNDNNEQEYRAIYSDNPYSFLAQENRMIIIGESCIKVFDDGIITAPLESFNDLISIKDKVASKVSKNNDFDVRIFKLEEFQQKANCPNEDETRATNGSERTKLQIGNGFAQVNTSSGPTMATNCWIIIRPYKRTLGVWFYAQRTISGAIDATIGYNNGSPQSHTVSRTIPPTLSYVQTRDIYTPVSGSPSNVHFQNYYAWGDTPSTDTAVLSCN